MATPKKPEPRFPSRTPSAAPEPEGPQDIETLKERYEELRDARTRAETNLQNAETQLAKLKEQARTAYGTDDLAALQAKLEDMKAENERKRQEYQAALDKIEGDLAKIETEYAESTQAQEE